jgi:hypothetical protein
MPRIAKLGLRIVFPAGLAALLAWLALAPDSSAQRFTTLVKLYQSHQLGQLSNLELSEFRTTALAALEAAEIHDPVVINEAPQRGHFHLYITDPALAWFTKCARGNAVYDASLDAVFVDRSLWKPLELSLVGESWPWTVSGPHQFGFTRTFFNLVLLHEIGHRQLHRSRGSLFDVLVSHKIRQQETEADTFAVGVIRSGYAKGILGKEPGVQEELNEAGIDPNLSAEERAVASTLYAATQMSVGLLFSKGSFSSLYADETHPSFGQRVKGMSEALSPLARNDQELNSLLEYFQQIASTMESVRQNHYVEIHLESPLEIAQFDENGLTLIDTSWRAWHVAASDVEGARTGGAINPQLVGTLPIPDSTVYASSAWSVPRLGVFVTSFRGDALQVNGNVLANRPDIAAALGGSSSSIVIPEVQPSAMTVHFGPTLSVLNQDRFVMNLDQSHLFSVIPRGVAQHDDQIYDASIADNTLHIPVYQHLGPVAGCVEIELRNPSDAKFVGFQLNDDFDGDGKLLAVPIGGHITRHYLVGKNASRLTVSELFENAPPQQRAIHDTFASQLSSAASPGLHEQTESYVTKVRLLPPSTILIALTGDSVYAFDTRANTLSLAFHPGTNVNILLGSKGYFGFFAVNGYKAYIGRFSRN